MNLREEVEAEKPDWHAATKRSEVQTLLLFFIISNPSLYRMNGRFQRENE